MARRSCYNCIYAICDPEVWLRWQWMGVPLVPQCANHPSLPGRLQDVTGTACCNYRPKPVMPHGESVRLIPLTDAFYAYVDAADYEWLSQWTWHLGGGGYAVRNERGKTILMHRQIMQPPKGMLVDHADGNKANNCRFNLRVCTRQENQRNISKQARARSQYKGVFYDKRCDKWYSKCRYLGKHRGLGYYDEEVDAARAYDYAAVQWFGEFARLNFPNEWPPERRAEVHAQRDPEKVRAEDRKKKTSRTKGAKTKNAKTKRAERKTLNAKRATKSIRATVPKARKKPRVKKR